MNRNSLIQLLIATALCLAGIVLLFLGFAYPPEGEIHYSVLVAYGETLTFVGSLLGIDYHYRYRS